MNATLLEALLIASGGLASLGSVLIVLLLLSSKDGLIKGNLYNLGYAGTYFFVGILVVFTGNHFVDMKVPALIPGIIFSLLGSILIFMALQKILQTEQKISSSSRWIGSLDTMSLSKILGTGALIAIVNFKNLAIFLSAASVLAAQDATVTFQILGVILIVFVFCFSAILPVIIIVILPGYSTTLLVKFRLLLEKHGRSIGIGSLLIFGLLFIIKGISSIAFHQ